MAFNILNIVGISALYYLVPGVLAWYTQTLGKYTNLVLIVNYSNQNVMN